MEYFLERKCEICGSSITDENPDGIGFGCRENVINPAKKDTFNKFNALNFHIKKVEKYRNIFLKLFQDTKFRNEFKKSFYKSISENERLSKKQLSIIEDMIMHKDLREFENLELEMKEVHKFMINGWNAKTEEEINFLQDRIEFYKTQYLGKNKK